jgi:hypothetical protein
MLWNGNECGKNGSNENIKASILETDYDRSKTTGGCRIFQILW